MSVGLFCNETSYSTLHLRLVFSNYVVFYGDTDIAEIILNFTQKEKPTNF